MRKSCLSGLVLLTAILLAISFALRRCFITPHPSVPPKENQSAMASTTPPTVELSSTPTALASAPLPTLTANPPYEERIPGLYIQEVFPLEQSIEAVGLAAWGGKWYLTGFDANQLPHLWEFDPAFSNAPVRQVALQDSGAATLCGLSAAEALLWTCLSGEGTVLLGIDPVSLEVRHRMPFTDTLQAITPIREGWIALDRSGERLYRVGPEGTILQVRTHGTDAFYNDCETVHGGILCAGTRRVGGAVLDVIDPYSLNLLARHSIGLRTPDGAWAPSRAIAFDGERFLLLIKGTSTAEIRVYRLDGRTLEEFVPLAE